MKARKALDVSLGIVTSIGGYLDVGAIATTALAGAAFGTQLLWVVILGSLCVAFLLEMGGRISAVSRHTVVGAMRERLGFNFFALTTTTNVLVNILTLSAEIGGICIALRLVTGYSVRACVLPVAAALWFIMWRGTFFFIQTVVSLLGMVTLVFVVAVYRMGIPWHDLARGLLPSLPTHDAPHYWFIAVGILGALISPYLFYFYSSGAIEDGWTESYIGVNRAIAGAGTMFGSTVAVSLLVVSALVFQPRGILVDQYEQTALLLTGPLGRAGYYLFAAALAIACTGGAISCCLGTGYTLAQGLGWNWGERLRPRQASRFALTCTAVLIISTTPLLAGIDALQLTTFAMALTALILPLTALPFLLVMNDIQYMGARRNGFLSNLAVCAVVVLASILALVTIPLEYMTR